jgi:hypothetical protein
VNHRNRRRCVHDAADAEPLQHEAAAVGNCERTEITGAGRAFARFDEQHA